MSDNFHFDMTGVSLTKALDIAMHEHKKVQGWRVDGPSDETKGRLRLLLYWTGADQASPLPAPLDLAATEQFVRAWLTFTDYGPEPDIDGHCAKGWRIYNEAWGHVAGEWQAFVAIEPTWLEYSK